MKSENTHRVRKRIGRFSTKIYQACACDLNALFRFLINIVVVELWPLKGMEVVAATLI
jgi:hypothetical protein